MFIFKYLRRFLYMEGKMTCKGICIRHKAQKPVGSGRYVSGQKRCQICEIFIKWDGMPSITKRKLSPISSVGISGTVESQGN